MAEGVRVAADTWRDLEAAIGARVDLAKLALLPPAKREDIAAAERAMGVTFPRELVASLGVHEGQSGGGLELVGDWRLYDLSSMVRTWKRFVSMKDEGIDEIRRDWIPVATDGNGNNVMLEGARVVFVPRVVRTPDVLAPDFLAWLRGIADDTASGKYDEALAVYRD